MFWGGLTRSRAAKKACARDRTDPKPCVTQHALARLSNENANACRAFEALGAPGAVSKVTGVHPMSFPANASDCRHWRG